MTQTGITVHAMICDEPLAYYAVMSVYSLADKILLYDTGTTDPLSRRAIADIILADTREIVDYRLMPRRNMQSWVVKRRWPDSERDAELGALRQVMLDDTDTEFTFLVDGDEVHYNAGVKAIVMDVIPNWPSDKLACYIPQRWHSERTQTHTVGPLQGRIFRTRAVTCRGAFPGEMHCDKSTGEVLWRRHPRSFAALSVPQFAHFELYVKPWRRTPAHPRRFSGPLPEIMLSNPSYYEELERARQCNQVT